MDLYITILKVHDIESFFMDQYGVLRISQKKIKKNPDMTVMAVPSTNIPPRPNTRLHTRSTAFVPISVMTRTTLQSI